MLLVPHIEDTFPVIFSNDYQFNDDDALYEFCLRNDHLKVERDAFGNVFLMPNTGGVTGIKNSEIIVDLGIWNRKAKLGKVFDSSTAFRLPSSAVRSPDAAWVSNELWNSLTEEEKKKFPPICPEFLIELMSDSDDLKDATEKMHKWMDNGCQLAWLIYPKKEEVRIFRANGTVDLIIGFNNILSGENILPNLEFDLSFLKSTN